MEKDTKNSTAYTIIARAVVLSVTTSLVFVACLAYFAYVYRADLFANIGVTSSAVAVSAPGTNTNSHEPIVDIVDRASDAVVSVVVTKDMPVLERYYEQVDPFGGFGPFGSIQVPRVRQHGTQEQEVGGGTGFFVDSEGLLVTNKHVVDDDKAKYSVVLNDGTSYEATVLVRDPQLDIAVLKVTDDLPTDGFSYLTFGDSASLKTGQTVIAIGNALAEFRNSVSVGVISGLSRSITAGDSFGGQTEQLEGVIQTDAAINPGNSGGPLLDLDGQVIGMNVAIAGGAQNIGFALPSNLVASIADSVQKYGEIRRPYLGVRYIELNKVIADNNDLPVSYGAWLKGGIDGPAVVKDSPAKKAGLQENDIIIEVNGTSLKHASLASIVRQQDVGAMVDIVYMRGNDTRTTSVMLHSAPTDTNDQ